MLIYAIRKLLSAVPTLLLLAALTFFLLRLAPGGPFDGERVFPAEIQANLNAKYGLDLPMPTQFIQWMEGVSRGDLKESFQYVGKPVTEIISESLPTSLWLGLLSLIASVGFGIPLGALAAWKRGTWIDGSAMFVAVAGVSLPGYLIASVGVLVFSLWLGWLPPALWEEPSSAVLPIATLASRPMAMIARLTRASVLDSLSADFIRTAHSKGLAPGRVLLHHALRNSLIPIVTLLGPITANLVTGSFLVEVIFQVPGMGKHFVSAVINRDYPLVMGVTLVYGVVLLLANLAVDLTYGLIDPRIRIEKETS